MLASIPNRTFVEWQAFEALEPFGEDRADLRTASIVQALWNIARDPQRYPKGWPVTDFLLGFGDWRPTVETPIQQTPAQMEAAILSWVTTANQARLEAGKS